MQILLVLRSAINLIRLKKAVVIMFMIYCSERTQSKTSKKKRYLVGSPVETRGELSVSSLSGLTKIAQFS